MSAVKKAESADPVVNPNAPLSQLLLDCTKEKYRMISLATRWAQEIRQRDQSSLQPQELLEAALREIMTHKVSLEEIEKLPPPPKVDKKELDFILPTLSLKDPEPEPAAKAPAEDKE